MDNNHAAISSEYAALCNLLQDWAKWQASYRPRNGYSNHAAGFANGGLKSFDDMWDQCVMTTMASIDASIGNLVPAQAAAINRCYGVCAVFRFPRANYEDMLQQAHESLIVMVKRKGVVL